MTGVVARQDLHVQGSIQAAATDAVVVECQGAPNTQLGLAFPAKAPAYMLQVRANKITLAPYTFSYMPGDPVDRAAIFAGVGQVVPSKDGNSGTLNGTLAALKGGATVTVSGTWHCA